MTGKTRAGPWCDEALLDGGAPSPSHTQGAARKSRAEDRTIRTGRRARLSMRSTVRVVP